MPGQRDKGIKGTLGTIRMNVISTGNIGRWIYLNVEMESDSTFSSCKVPKQSHFFGIETNKQNTTKPLKFSVYSVVGMMKEWWKNGKYVHASIRMSVSTIMVWTPWCCVSKSPWMLLLHIACLVSVVLGKFSPGISLACRLRFQITDEAFCFFKRGIKSTLEFWAISPFFRSVHSS